MERERERDVLVPRGHGEYQVSLAGVIIIEPDNQTGAKKQSTSGGERGAISTVVVLVVVISRLADDDDDVDGAPVCGPFGRVDLTGLASLKQTSERPVETTTDYNYNNTHYRPKSPRAGARRRQLPLHCSSLPTVNLRGEL